MKNVQTTIYMTHVGLGDLQKGASGYYADFCPRHTGSNYYNIRGFIKGKPLKLSQIPKYSQGLYKTELMRF